MIKNIGFGVHNWTKEKCIECGKIIEQYDGINHECCNLCRIANALERYISIFRGE